MPDQQSQRKENPDYLSEQLITYIGNKRSLLSFISGGLDIVRTDLGKRRLSTFDVFSGSGVVSRMMKRFSSTQYANDMEDYARIISTCYLSNKKDLDIPLLEKTYSELETKTQKMTLSFLSEDGTRFKRKLPGFISEYYAPRDMNGISPGERCFYTPYNACYIDCMRQCISELPADLQPFFIAPLLSEASVHANTGGVFKGFYKNSRTGVGKFGGNGENALTRILGRISLPFPVFSRYNSRSVITQGDANTIAASGKIPAVDVAYIDPPYNQHPYGSNYFMLNLIANYEKPSPEEMSRVSGIPRGWNRSSYNRRRAAKDTFRDLTQNLDARYLLVSFNNEGFISEDEMTSILSETGDVKVLESDYNAYRASRNLSARSIHTREFLYVVKKHR